MSTPCLLMYDTTEALSVSTIIVVLIKTQCHCDWSVVHAPWNKSPCSSRCAPQPESLVSKNRVQVTRDGLTGKPWQNRSLLIHHFRWCLIWCVIEILWVSGKTWGFHWTKSAIWSGCKCSLPSITNWTAHLVVPKEKGKLWLKQLTESVTRPNTLESFGSCLEVLWQCCPVWGIPSLWKQKFERELIPISPDWLLVQERKSIEKWTVCPLRELDDSDPSPASRLGMETGLSIFSSNVLL